MKKIALALSIGATAALTVGTSLALAPARADAMPVFDATNYAQNILQAARALEQISNQVRSLQNEAAMLQNMARNLEKIDFPELDRLRSAVARIDELMGDARGIGFKLDTLDEKIRKLFPGDSALALSRDARVADARARLDAARQDFEHRMKLQAEIAANVREDSGLLADLIQRSQGANGSLQAQQSANQLLALGIKQQLQLQELVAAEYRGQAVDRARKVQAEEEGKAATRRFLGSGRAYSPGS
ncbi:MAG TPA: P-type conjugative transfer protein TrbJ [Allosphingosinicella sp.]|nr:P-type conjugative transfer protein TrbJ [Allosphingosinicella sp.]